MIKIHRISHQWDGRLKDLEEFYNCCTSNAKILFGAVNNSIFLLMGDALTPFINDKKVKRFAKKVWKEWKDYEVGLKYCEAGFFNISLMHEETRRMYADDLTRDSYFDFWTAQGGEPYQLIRPLCLALANKYRLLLERYGVKQAKEKSMLMMMVGRFELAKEIHGMMVTSTAKNCGVMRADFEKIYGCYSLHRVFAAFMKLLHEAIPELRHIQPDEIEQKGFDMLQTQINDTVDSLDFYFGGCANTTAEFEELFRTRGCQKKMQKDIAELRAIFSEYE